jgi:hypothetical protein
MLHVVVPGQEMYDEETETFSTPVAAEFDIEHSLVSLSKWESRWEVPFLATPQKTTEQVLGYIQMMVVGPEPAPEVFQQLSNDNLLAINTYIGAQMTATWFNEPKHVKNSPEVITAELIYYWMIALGIPFECQYWHLNRLMTLIKVCNIKNQKPKKMSAREAAAQQRALNAQRKAQYGTTG